MAAVTYTHTNVQAFPYPAQLYQWAGIAAAADTCNVLECPQLRDKSVQIAGTFSAVTIAIHGSNDGTNYSVLEEPDGTAITAIAADGIFQIGQLTRYVKVVPGGAAASAAITVSLLGATGRV